jgi:hypothetical protein
MNTGVGERGKNRTYNQLTDFRSATHKSMVSTVSRMISWSGVDRFSYARLLPSVLPSFSGYATARSRSATNPTPPASGPITADFFRENRGAGA